MAIAQTRFDQIRDLVNQWEQLVGYTVTVPDWMVWEMAGGGTSAGYVTNIFGVGQYMHDHTEPGPYHLDWADVSFQPWAWYGMSAAEYNSKLEAFDAAFLGLTGQSVPQDIVDKALREHQGTMTGGQFSTWLQAQDSIKNTYGWLKYGLDFQQFQTQKLQMTSAFGHDLTDTEAVAQLQYMHQAQGPNMSANVVPTFTQTEKKSANVGAAQSVIR